MQGLYELLALLPPDYVPDFSPRLNKLYVFLQQHEYVSQEQATIEYLGDEKRIKYFRELVLDLKKELIRYLLAYPSWQSHSQKAVYEQCHRDFAMYRILLAHNKRTTAIEMARGLLPKLQQWELHSMAQIVADDLLNHYTITKGSPKMQKKYRAILQKELEHTNVYSQVRQYYTRINSIGNTRESYSKSVVEEFDQIAKAVQLLLHPKRHNTNRFIYNIMVSKYLSVHDYENLLRCCDEALNSFPADLPNIRSFRFMFLFHKITGLTAIGQLKEAKEVARTAQSLMPKGNFNWHVVLLKRIIVCFHNSEYQEAYELYKEYEQYEKTKKRLPTKKGYTAHEYPVIVEYWEIIRGYLYFLNKVGLLEEYEKERFYLGKFLNEVPIYSKDKAGNNINILMI